MASKAKPVLPSMEEYQPPQSCFGVCPACQGTVLIRRYLMDEKRFVEEAQPQHPWLAGAHVCPANPAESP
jgi:hypothetical protein